MSRGEERPAAPGPVLAGTTARAQRAYELLSEGRRLREGWPPTSGLGRTLRYLGDAADRPAHRGGERWVDAAGVCEQLGDTAGAVEASSRRTGPPLDSAPSRPVP